jgi:hypothetical protein
MMAPIFAFCGGTNCFSTSAYAADQEVVFVALSKVELAKRCTEWYTRATDGEWFNEKDERDLLQAEEAGTIESTSGCQPFVALEKKCEKPILKWKEIMSNAGEFMKTIEEPPGCRALAGFSAVCKALEKLLAARVKFSDKRKDLLSDCYKAELRGRRIRIEFLRPDI